MWVGFVPSPWLILMRDAHGILSGALDLLVVLSLRCSLAGCRLYYVGQRAHHLFDETDVGDVRRNEVAKNGDQRWYELVSNSSLYIK